MIPDAKHVIDLLRIFLKRVGGAFFKRYCLHERREKWPIKCCSNSGVELDWREKLAVAIQMVLKHVEHDNLSPSHIKNLQV